MAAETAWDAVPIRGQKWSATLVILVLTAVISAMLTRVQLRRHAGGKSSAMALGRRMFSFVWEVAQALPAAYENQALRGYVTWMCQFCAEFIAQRLYPYTKRSYVEL